MNIKALIYPDGFRAQYILKTVLKEIDRLNVYLSDQSLIDCKDDSFLGFFNNLINEADQAMLPCFAYEITSAKDRGILEGPTSIDRYKSFFIRDTGWTDYVVMVHRKYEGLFEGINSNISTSVNNLLECIGRLARDECFIRDTIFKSNNDVVVDIDALSSDRHKNGRQPLIISFSSGKKLVYKPTDLTVDALFCSFLELLDLELPYDLRYASVYPRGDYGWMEYIEHLPCSSIEEIELFYRRSGVLLAVCDFLNYTDGHVENLIASGPYPVIVDGETFFQPLIGERTSRSILFTQLIQLYPEGVDDLPQLNSALQALSTERAHVVHPYAVSDGTDEMKIQFRGVSAPETQNTPVLLDMTQPSHAYLDFIIDGYITGYKRISSKRNDLLGNSEWWDKLSASRPRYIVRPTLYYAMLIRLAQQPINIEIDGKLSQEFLRKCLSIKTSYILDTDKFMRYEIDSLMRFDIPYFYHRPSERDIFDTDGGMYIDVFKSSAIDHILMNCSEFDETYMMRSLDIISREIAKSSEQSDISR